MIKLDEVREGSTVMVRGNFGGSTAVLATVDYVDSNIKNGMPGIEYTVKSSGEKLWAYLVQIEKVVTY